MFWKYNSQSTLQIESLLDKDVVTLAEVLDQEVVIQECKSQNAKLVEFLTKRETIVELIDLIINEPASDADETTRFKFPHIAAEILSCEVPQLSMAITGDMALLEKLYSFVEKDGPVNPLLASFFSKAFGSLIHRKSDQNWYNFQVTWFHIFEFLKSKEFVADCLRHMGTSAIADLILKLVSFENGTETNQDVLNWFNEKQLVQSIIGFIDVKFDRDTHDNATRLLLEILRVSRENVTSNEQASSPLLDTIESPESVERLLKIIFAQQDGDDCPPPESVIVNCISILLAILETRPAVMTTNNNGNNILPSFGQQQSNMNNFGGNFNGDMVSASANMSPESAAKQQAVLDSTLNVMMPWLENFTRLLTDPPNSAPMKTTAGVLDPPLGQARLGVAKLICSLLSTNNKDVNLKLQEFSTVNILLDLFFKYSLNNFLHAQVEKCIRLVFEWDAASCAADDRPADQPKTPPTVEMAGEVSDSAKEAAVPSHDDADKPSSGEQSPANESTGEVSSGDQSVGEQNAGEQNAGERSTAETTEQAESVCDNPLLVDLYTNCRLVNRVLEAFEENEGGESKPGIACRKGYMGHLTKIANTMHQHMGESSRWHGLIGEQLLRLDEDTRHGWEKFVEGKLAEVNERNTIVPASSFDGLKRSSSDEEDAEINPTEYSRLQDMQQMSENFVDAFGFGDSDFNDDGSNDSNGDIDTLTGVLSDDAGGSPSSAAKRAEDLFEAVCEQRFTSFPGDESDGEADDDDDDDDDDFPWADKTKEIVFESSQGKEEKVEDKAGDDDDDDEKFESESVAKKAKSSVDNNKMEVDDDDDDGNVGIDEDVGLPEDWMSRNNNGESDENDPAVGGSKLAAMDTGNPWDSSPSASSTTIPFDNPFSPRSEEGWANFGCGQNGARNDDEDDNDSEDSEMSPVKTSGRFDVTSVADKNASPAASPQKVSPDDTLTTPPPVVQMQ